MSGAEGAAALAGQAEVSVWERYEAADVRALIDGYPLAWVCGGAGDQIEASLLPLVGVYDDAGELVELIGHLARSNPLYALLSADPRATILFKGPDAYVSPEHAGRRDWGPTWNYAQVRIGAEVRFDEALTDHSLELLTDAVESERAAPWNASELGERYAAMKRRIIGFRARVTGLSAKFKLGQDETSETLHAILGTLPDDAVTAWMRRMNPGR